MIRRSHNPQAAYVAVTAAYWAFMLTDGALRMLVLLHFHTLGFSPVTLAYMFLLYELMGMITNLSAGWIAARFGLSVTLFAGLGLQIAALLLLMQLDPGWMLTMSVVYVMAVQGLSGIAKDLTKMSAKSAVKTLAPAADGALFRWVAVLTGSKNAIKGLGFLLGTVLLGTLGFVPAIAALAISLIVVLALVAMTMPKGLPVGRKSAKFTEVFSKDRNINLLSLARLFLFGARDTWFVVGVPVFFHGVLSDGSATADRAAFFQIGAFMAVWIIGYGIVQASAPKLLRASDKPLSGVVSSARFWVGLLTLIPVFLSVGTYFLADAPILILAGFLSVGLLIFGAVFALNSALHSYLILAFSRSERVTLDVGFYYMSNAGGRLVGTLLSGLSYQIGGLTLCLATAAVLSALSWGVATRLDRVHEE